MSEEREKLIAEARFLADNEWRSWWPGRSQRALRACADALAAAPVVDGAPPVEAFEAWHARWWRNAPNPVAKSNASSAFLAGWDAALADVDEDVIVIPRPVVPFGPTHKSEDEATADYLTEVVHKIDTGFTTVGGSNVTATIRKLLLDAAKYLRGER